MFENLITKLSENVTQPKNSTLFEEFDLDKVLSEELSLLSEDEKEKIDNNEVEKTANKVEQNLSQLDISKIIGCIKTGNFKSIVQIISDAYKRAGKLEKFIIKAVSWYLILKVTFKILGRVIFGPKNPHGGDISTQEEFNIIWNLFKYGPINYSNKLEGRFNRPLSSLAEIYCFDWSEKDLSTLLENINTSLKDVANANGMGVSKEPKLIAGPYWGTSRMDNEKFSNQKHPFLFAEFIRGKIHFYLIPLDEVKYISTKYKGKEISYGQVRTMGQKMYNDAMTKIQANAKFAKWANTAVKKKVINESLDEELNSLMEELDIFNESLFNRYTISDLISHKNAIIEILKTVESQNKDSYKFNYKESWTKYNENSKYGSGRIIQLGYYNLWVTLYNDKVIKYIRVSAEDKKALTTTLKWFDITNKVFKILKN